MVFFTLAPYRQLDLGSRLQRTHHHRQVFRAFNAAVIQLEDDVPGLQTGLAGRALRIHAHHQRTTGAWQAEGLSQFL
jgi:hypothetical protein